MSASVDLEPVHGTAVRVGLPGELAEVTTGLRELALGAIISARHIEFSDSPHSPDYPTRLRLDTPRRVRDRKIGNPYNAILDEPD